MTGRELIQALRAAAEMIHDNRGQVVIEDEYGLKYEVSRAFVIGGKTDDPGLVIRIRGAS